MTKTKLTVGLVALTIGYLCAASIADAQTAPGTVFSKPPIVTTCAGSPCSGTAPTLGTDGQTLVTVSGVKILLCADEGETLSGAGTLDVYFYEERLALWALVPSLAITVPAAAASDRCVVVLEDRATFVPYGRFVVVPNAVTLSGGDLTVHHIVTVKRAP